MAVAGVLGKPPCLAVTGVVDRAVGRPGGVIGGVEETSFSTSVVVPCCCFLGVDSNFEESRLAMLVAGLNLVFNEPPLRGLRSVTLVMSSEEKSPSTGVYTTRSGRLDISAGATDEGAPLKEPVGEGERTLGDAVCGILLASLAARGGVSVGRGILEKGRPSIYQDGSGRIGRTDVF